MEISGLIAELVLPGGITVASVFLVAWEFSLAPIDRISAGDSATVIALGIVAAYLIGLVSREVPVVSPTKKHYRRHLQDLWPDQTRYLLDHLASPDHAVAREVLETAPSTHLALTEDWTHDFIGLLRDYLLAKSSDSWAQYVMYQWNVARIARNSILPLWVLTSGLLAVGSHRMSVGEHSAGAKFFAGALAALCLSSALRYVYRVRLCWHVEILVRTACALIAFDGLSSLAAPLQTTRERPTGASG